MTASLYKHKQLKFMFSVNHVFHIDMLRGGHDTMTYQACLMVHIMCVGI